ncbi:MAG: 4-hydroxythreonine-4-phosphate dehydrogenase PdxA [Chitinophagaceae bacterium]
MSNDLQKPIIGFSCGDLNGIGIEIIIKSLSNSEILNICTPVIFASNKSINFYRKTLPEANMSFNNTKDFSKLSHKQINIFNVWEEDVTITPGALNEVGGKYALQSLEAATEALAAGNIDALVTAPIHKKNIQSDTFKHSGHTPYFKEYFAAKDVLMLMVAENIKVGLVTEHIPVLEVANAISKEAILYKLRIMNGCLKEDFGIDKPRIAVLALNPHAGDESLIGKEEETIIKPAIKEAKQSMLVFGPYSSDAFFARGQYENFDAVLAMYHDQGLIPFKSLAIGEGVNYTAGLPVIRTSPDHGTAFDIAGKGIAHHESFLAAIFEAIDIVRRRNSFGEARQNPLRKMSARLIANAVDE